MSALGIGFFNKDLEKTKVGTFFRCLFLVAFGLFVSTQVMAQAPDQPNGGNTVPMHHNPNLDPSYSDPCNFPNSRPCLEYRTRNPVDVTPYSSTQLKAIQTEERSLCCGTIKEEIAYCSVHLGEEVGLLLAGLLTPRSSDPFEYEIDCASELLRIADSAENVRFLALGWGITPELNAIARQFENDEAGAAEEKLQKDKLLSMLRLLERKWLRKTITSAITNFFVA